MPRILFVPGDFDGCAFYRCFFPAKYLQRAGWEVCLPPYTIYTANAEHIKEIRAYDLSVSWGADIVVFQRPGWKTDAEANRTDLKAIKQYRKMGVTVVCDNDDNSRRLPDWHPGKRMIHQHADARPYLERCFQEGDWLTVSTEELRREYKQFNARTTVIKNYLDWEMWDAVTPQFEEDRGGRVRVGWMGAAHYRDGDLRVLDPWVGDFVRAHPNVDFVVAGYRSEEVHERLGIPLAQRVTIPGVMFRTGELPSITATMDIGLVPLALDDESRRFNDGKSWLKGLEYSACGIVPVCSPSEPYREFIEEGGNGYLAGTADEWFARCSALVREDGLRRSVGAAARVVARAHSLDRHVHEWEDFFAEVSERRANRHVGAGAAPAVAARRG